MSMAHALQRNRHAHPRYAYNHLETTIPKDGHTQTQPDSRWFRFMAIHISEVVMNAKSQHQCPHYPAIYHSHNTVTQHPILSCTISQHHRETHSLSSCRHTSHTDRSVTINNHSPMWIDISHRDISTQIPFHILQAHGQVYAQKCSDPDIAFITAFTQTVADGAMYSQSGESHPITKPHTQTQAVQHACSHTYQTATQLQTHTLLDHDTDTNTYKSPGVTDMQFKQKNRSHSHIYTLPQTHTVTVTWCHHTHTYILCQTQ